MQYEKLPDGTQIPVLGLGTWQMGGGSSADYSRDDEMVGIIEQAIDMGYTHLDTAEVYGKNHCEELVGRAMKAFNRNDLFITTKVSPDHATYDGVHNAIQGSLKRLDTDYVDLYLIHWPSKEIPQRETFRALNELVADGRVRRVGVSNYNVEQMQEAIDLCDTPIATNQVRYNLLDRKVVQNGVLSFCQEQGIPLTAYSPVKGGVLEHAAVQAIAQNRGVSPAQIAIRWLIQQPGVITIPMSQDLKHLRDNIAALEFELSPEEMERLDNAESGD